MPLASKNSHGIVKIGDGIRVSTDGIISVDFSDFLDSAIKGELDTLKLDVESLKSDTTSITKDVSVIEDRVTDVETGDKLIPIYQTKQDTTLVTVDKTVVGGINELQAHTQLNASNIQNIQKDVQTVKTTYATISYVDDVYTALTIGAHKPIVFDTRADFISWLDGIFVRDDGKTPDKLNIGDVVFIKEQGVPDYWVSSKSSPMTINDFSEYEVKIEIPELKFDNDSITLNTSNEMQAVKLKNAFTNISDTVVSNDFNGMVYITEKQYQELIAYGQIVVDGQTISYNEDTIYVTPDEKAFSELTLSGTSVLTSAEQFNSHIQIMVEFETDGIHAGFDCVLHPYDTAVCFVTYDVLVNGQPNFGTAYLNDSGNVVINVPSGLTFTNVHAKYVVYGG